MKKIWILTLFSNYFDAFKDVGVIGKAFSNERSNIELKMVSLSDHSPKNFKGVDGAPYGGGAGMVIRADVLKDALLNGVVEAGEYGENFKKKLHVIYTSPRGELWSNSSAKKFAKSEKDLVFICGRYEGIDERFLESYVDETISIGDFVLSGGEIAVQVILDSMMRFKTGVLGNSESLDSESFEENLLDYPVYTRPAEFEGRAVPGVLTSGDHKKIDIYRKEESLRLTKLHRPDLLSSKGITNE